MITIAILALAAAGGCILTARAFTSRARRRVRGTAAVVALLASAADVLLSALTGWPRLGPPARRVGRVIRDAWYRGARSDVAPLSVITVTTIEETDD